MARVNSREHDGDRWMPPATLCLDRMAEERRTESGVDRRPRCWDNEGTPMRHEEASRRQAKKSTRRKGIMEDLAAGITKEPWPSNLRSRARSERDVQLMMVDRLETVVRDIYGRLQPGLTREKCKTKADSAVRWEGDCSDTIHYIQILGTRHRPDFVVNLDNCSIGVEIKRGGAGSSVRDGLGQSLVYSQVYDFVLYCFVDTSADRRILNSMRLGPERRLLESLWANHNIRFVVI